MDTQNNKKKRSKWFRAIRPIALVLVLVMILTYATFSWMKRDWTPTLSQNNVKIVAGSSLVFMFGDDELDDDIPLNQLAGMNNFVFKSVSNCTGESEDFFALNYSPRGEHFDKFMHLSTDQVTNDELDESGAINKEMLLGKKYGYVELTFGVKAAAGENDFDKIIRLANTSKISGAATGGNANNSAAAMAMRVSVTVPDGNGGTRTILYSPRGEHKGITNNHIEGVGYAADGVNRYSYDEHSGNYVKVDKAKDDTDIVVSKEDVKTLVTGTENQNDALFTLKKGSTEQIIVRIWLEGEDSSCTDAVLNSELDILLRFEAVDIVS